MKTFLRRCEFKHNIYISSPESAFLLCTGEHDVYAPDSDTDDESTVPNRIDGIKHPAEPRAHSIWRRCFHLVPIGAVDHSKRPSCCTLDGVTKNHAFYFTGSSNEVAVAYRSCYSCAHCSAPWTCRSASTSSTTRVVPK